MMANISLRVDEVMGRPILVIEGTPYRVVAVDRDRIINLHVFRGPPNVLDIVLKRELWSMHANHHQSAICIFISPGPHIGERASPIDAGIGPEVDKNNPAAKTAGRQWPRIEPLSRAAE